LTTKPKQIRDRTYNNAVETKHIQTIVLIISTVQPCLEYAEFLCNASSTDPRPKQLPR